MYFVYFPSIWRFPECKSEGLWDEVAPLVITLMNVTVCLLVLELRVEMVYLVIEWLKNGDKVMKPPHLEA